MKDLPIDLSFRLHLRGCCLFFEETNHLAIIKIAQETLDFWRLCITQRFALLIVALSLLIIFCYPSQDALIFYKTFCYLSLS